MKKLETSFEFICEWFEKARDNANVQGRKESALLWADGLKHLKHMQTQIKDLKAQLAELEKT